MPSHDARLNLYVQTESDTPDFVNGLIEILDEVQMEACIAFSKLEGYEVKPTLFYEFHGSEAGAAEQAEQAKAISDEHGGSAFQWTAKTEDRSKLWQARHDAYYAAMAMAPGKRPIATDVCVPISRLAECMLAARDDSRNAGFRTPIVGHVGDGNFHMVFCVDPEDADELARAKAVSDRLVERALAMGGTCTGEHGIGAGKIDFLAAEHGADAVALMRTLKMALDPTTS